MGSGDRTLEGGHRDAVKSLDFSSDSQWFASASNDGTIRLWDAETRALQHILELWAARTEDLQETIQCHRPGARVVTSPPERQMVKSPIAGVKVVTISPNDQWLVSVSCDESISLNDITLTLWDTETVNLQFELEDHRKGLSVTTFSPNGRWLAFASGGETIRIYDADSVEV